LDVASKVYNLTVIKRHTMKRKQLALLLILGVCITKTAFSQDITGTWEGYYGTGQYYDGARGMRYHFGKDSFFLHMELQQEGRKIVGLFSYSSDPHQNNPVVMYKVSALLDKKNPLSFFRLIMGGVMEDNTARRASNLMFHSMEATYRQDDGSEELYGNWYPERGTGGVYWVKKTSPSVSSRLGSK
jgi:hypothetical protein